jgi:hypothetical protein
MGRMLRDQAQGEIVQMRLERLLPLFIWIAAALLVAVVGWWSLTQMRISTGVPWRAFPEQPWLDGLARWDSFWYFSIADVGYGYALDSQTNYAFFPGFPVVMWAVGSLVGDFYLGGIIASSVFAIVSLYLFSAWLREVAPRENPIGPMVALMFGPTAFILAGVAYSESLFLASAIASFLLLERGRPLAAGFAVLPALATRPLGFALVVGLVIRSMELHPTGSSSGPLDRVRDWARGPQVWILTAVLGLGVYPLFLWFTAGDPLVFLTAGAEGWGHGLELETVLKTGGPVSNPYPEFGAVVAIHAVVLLVSMVALGTVKRTFGLGYAVYAAIAIVLPTFVRPSWIGIGRYALIAFPVWAAVALILNRDLPRVRWIVLAGSVAAFILQFSLFARWYFVA